MSHLSSQATNVESAGGQLRRWRTLRGKSQLDLALDAGVSQRHVSFVETGRSVPSRQMIVDLSDTLRIPLRERNAIMTAAGYAATYRDAPLADGAMRQVERAITRMLRVHEPFPALVLDRYWNVLETNSAAPKFFGRLIDLDAQPKPRNLLRLLFDPNGLRPHLANWSQTSRALLDRFRREAVGGVVDDGMRALLGELQAFPDVPRDGDAANTNPSCAIVPIGFRVNGRTLNLFSMITTVCTPQSVTAEELRLDTIFPVDDETECAYLEFVGEAK